MLELVWIFCLQVSVGIFGWVGYNPQNFFVYLVSIIGTRMWKIERRKSGVCGEVLNRWHVCRDGMPKRAIKLTVGAVGRIRKTEAGKGGDRKEEDHLVPGSTRGRG